MNRQQKRQRKARHHEKEWMTSTQLKMVKEARAKMVRPEPECLSEEQTLLDAQLDFALALDD